VTVDDDTAKAITTGVGQTVAIGVLGWVWLWFSKITGLPKRTDRLERRAQASDRLQLALADMSLAKPARTKEEKEARESLREARQGMYDAMTKAPGTKE
jgi:hypothetical protein